MAQLNDLREFIKKVDELGELAVVEGADWNLEIGAATYMSADSPTQPALLFDKIKGYKPGYRVFTSPTTDRRIASMFGLPLDATRLEQVKLIKDRLNQPFEPVPPVEVKSGPIMENVFTGDDVDLFMFPTPKWFTSDGGRYIGTGDAVAIKDPDEGWVNVSTQRIQIHDRNTATIFFEPGRQGGIIREKYWRQGKSCPTAVTCGSDPLLIWATGGRIPWGVCEYDYVGWWQQAPVEVIKAPLTGLPVPSHAEIVLEGEMVPPDVETRKEGPFSEWTGHYSPGKEEAAFRVKSILHRNDPIILGVLPYLGPGITAWAVQPVMRSAQVWSELDRQVPGVKGVWVPHEFGVRATVVISLEQKYGGHAKQAAVAALSPMGYMTKYIIVVDEDVDPSNLREVLFALGLRADPSSFDILRDIYGGNLDPLLSPDRRQAGDFTHSAMIIPACKPYHWKDQFPPTITIGPELKEQVKSKWGELFQ